MSDIRAGACISLAITVVLLLWATTNAGEKAGTEKDRAADALFAEGVVPRLQIQLSADAAESLRQQPRSWTTCTLVENDSQVHKDVAIKIKGSYGSTRDLDDRPALTLKMDKHAAGRHFHGLDKFHLNNSVQDESLLREWLGADIFRAAGIPAPRVTHARLWIDGHDVGIYVLKESFDEEFLRRCFTQPDGNLYDGGLHQDIDDGLERDEGRRGEPGATILEPLPALVAMTVMENPVWRKQYRVRLRELLPLLSADDRLVPRIDKGVERLRPLTVQMGPDVAERFDAAVTDLRRQLAARAESIREQAEAPGFRSG